MCHYAFPRRTKTMFCRLLAIFCSRCSRTYSADTDADAEDVAIFLLGELHNIEKHEAFVLVL